MPTAVLSYLIWTLLHCCRLNLIHHCTHTHTPIPVEALTPQYFRMRLAYTKGYKEVIMLTQGHQGSP